MVFMKKETVEFVKVDDLFELGKTKRGNCGFGSSDSKKVKFEESKEENEVIVIEDATMSENVKIIVSGKTVTFE